MDGNIDKNEITNDLESMKDAGIGYALFLEVNVGIPRGKVDFLSEKWQELYETCCPGSRKTGNQDHPGIWPGMGGKRRSLGDSGSVDDAPCCQRHDSDRTHDIQRSPYGPETSKALFRREQLLLKHLKNNAITGTKMFASWPFRNQP